MRVGEDRPVTIRTKWTAFCLTVVVGCGGPDTPPPLTGDTDPETTETTTTTTAIPACDPPLALSPEVGEVPPFQLLQFSASGGTANYRFSVNAPALGDVHPTTGTYGAPGEIGSVDTVVLTDTQCGGESRVDVTVLEGLSLLPISAEILPETAFDLEVHGGIGATTCALIADGSGATLDAACSYAAGTEEGTDIIEVVDSQGYSAQSTLVVTSAAELRPEGYAHWVLPLGANLYPASGGGSGVLDAAVLSGTATIVDGAVVGNVEGRSTIEVTDRFAGFAFQVTLDVVAPLVPDAPWMGARTNDSRAIGAGDLDGDGYDDLIIGVRESNSDRWEGGQVMIFAGGPAGIVASPVQTFRGDQREQEMGSSVAIADVDGDGESDLIIGAMRDDFTATDVGSVRIHLGIAGGFFQEEPAWILHGTNGSDRAGASVGACDVDGDTYVDIIVGADGAEDRSLVDYPSGTGALFVFRGTAGGFIDVPTVARYGARLDDQGAWELSSGLDLGERDMAVGDVNGDGLCDVLASVADDPIDAALGGTGEGYAVVYHGVAGDLLSVFPDRAYANTVDSSADFGRRLDLADFDGDGRDDVVIGSHAFTAANSSSGGIFVYLASSDDGRASTDFYDTDEADWFATGPGSDNLGRGLGVGDVDGDGVPDLIGGHYLEDDPFSNAGQVLVWSGASIAVAPAGDRFVDAFLIWNGDEDDARLGESVAAVGDVDGDGLMDLASWASEHDHYGLDVGRGFVWSNSIVTPLDHNGGPAGDKSGSAITWFDVDGDGIADAISGAPHTPESTGLLTGAVDAFLAEPVGFSEVATSIERGIDQVNSSDRFGEYLSGESDFDGDGWLDLAIGSRLTATPSTWDPPWTNPLGCVESLGNAGAVLIHRGGASGFDPVPAWVWFAPPGVSNIEAMRAGFDHNGDGYDDFIVGDEDWSDGGGFSVVFGRPVDPAGILAICDNPVTLALESGGRLGHAMAPLGDIDGDGCDEVVVSGDDEDLGTDDRGGIHVLWGWDRPGCPNRPGRTTLAPILDDVEAGTSLDGGADVDGDGIPDLIVASEDLEVGGNTAGGAWLVSGSYLRSLPREDLVEGGWVDPAVQVVHPLAEPGRDTLLEGPGTVDFGTAISLVPDPLDGTRAALAVGVPLGGIGGTPLSGGVLVYRWSVADDTWEDSPYAIVAGESHLRPGELGNSVRGTNDRGTPTVLVGAQWSEQFGPDRGAVYPAPLR